MNVLLFGATGMVGQGVLRECLLDHAIRLVQTVGRSAIDRCATCETAKSRIQRSFTLQGHRIEPFRI